MRIIIAVFVNVAVSVFVLASLALAPAPRGAHACSVGPPMFDLLMEGSNVIVLVDIVEVGGAENTQPTVTPRATYTPTVTSTPGSPTPTIDHGAPIIDSPTPQPTATPFDLTGYGATANLIKTYRGTVTSPLTIDAQGRAELERAIREQEARRPEDGVPPCPIWLGHIPYVWGQHYVLFGTGGGDQIETGIYGWWEVRTDEAGEQYVPLPGNLMVTREVYETYLRGFEAEPDERWYYVRAERIPFDTFERMITGAPPARPPILPPDAGSAGLKD